MVIGGGVKLRSILRVRKELLTLHVRLMAVAAVCLDLKLRLHGLEDGMLLRRRLYLATSNSTSASSMPNSACSSVDPAACPSS